ncbi:glycosyltransferase family 4 protein [Microbulbifer sp. YPW1]|uniref:glycosyltransferase family 4 protein n=1 Tax=Microbulbifer sp. YPW1 TaxID=2745199 RepID=UPI00159B6A39|nr:glycosyltransferase family 4 protein [Microbulbifer sp. YPW1]QKX17107.1 glycosyltransferase family 4 protein [Microbulbifer sp. YPW1]
MLRIGFITSHNPLDKNSFSGTVYYMYHSLQKLQNVDVEIVCQSFHSKRNMVEELLFKLGKRLAKGAGFSPLHDFLNRLKVRRFEAVLKPEIAQLKARYDILLAPVASNIIGRLKDFEKLPPIVFVTDATYTYLHENYGQPLRHEYVENEQKTYSSAARIVFSSEYMLGLAKKTFTEQILLQPEKFTHFPFGLNLDSSVSSIIKPPLSAGVNLVFIGKDWERKGGQEALEALSLLTEMGIQAHLTIIGASPDSIRETSRVTIHPFLDKNTQVGQQQFSEVMANSHFLLLPTKADCTPMVIAEANAFGIPALVSNVGGIPSLVEHGVNGLLFQPDASGLEYAEVIRIWLDDPEAYRRFSATSKRVFEERLNWESWAKNIVRNAHEILGWA